MGGRDVQDGTGLGDGGVETHWEGGLVGGGERMAAPIMAFIAAFAAAQSAPSSAGGGGGGDAPRWAAPGT